MPINGSGAESTIFALISIWIVFVAFGVVIFWRSVCRYQSPRVLMLFVTSIVVGPSVFIFSIFPVVHAFFSFPYSQIFNVAVWQNEISTGVLALRVTSIILTWQLAAAVFKFIPLRRNLVDLRMARGLNNDEIADFRYSVTAGESRLWFKNDLFVLVLSQISFCLVSLSAVWVCAVSGFNSWITALVSWGLLFIVDDCGLVADYCNEFDSLPLGKHAAKILAIDILLLISIPCALYLGKFSPLWFFFSVAMVSIIFVALLFFFRAKHFMENDGGYENGKGHSSIV